MKTSQAETLLLSLSTLTDFKGTVGFKIAKNVHKLQDELKDYIQFKSDLFKKYGEEKDGNLVVDKTKENFGEFMKELNKLGDVEIDIPLVRFNENEIIECGMTSAQMSLIWELIDES